MMMDLNQKLERIDFLRQMNSDVHSERDRIRAIMNGGPDGIKAVMMWDHSGKSSSSSSSTDADDFGADLPTVNLIASGMERLAQMVGRAPTLKPPHADDEKIRERFQRRIDIVNGWDYLQRMELQFPQVGRWLPGYGFCVWTIKQATAPNGDPYPKVELRDPYDTYPGWFGPDQQPEELAIVRKVPIGAVEQAYPESFNWGEVYEALKKKRGGSDKVLVTRSSSGSQWGTGKQRGWEGKSTGVEVIEYYYPGGTCYVIPELKMELVDIPNPIDQPTFVLAQRFSFDRNISQYHHVIGLMGMIAKLNMLGLIAAEDSVFRETNIIGELESGVYERGRFALNLFAPGSRVEKPVGDLQQQVWAQIDRLISQMRIGSAYDVSQDAISPNSFATGAAIQELGASSVNNVKEYHTVLRHGMERVDERRLAWAEAMWPNKRCKIFDIGGGREWYRPSQDIKGDHRTRRLYGAMATWDDSRKAVVGLQYNQAGAIDIETIQENMDGLTDIGLINERIRARKAEEVLMARLANEDPNMNPAASMALVEIMVNPTKALSILQKHFTPEDPQLSPEEQQFLQQGGVPGGPPQEGVPQGPPPVTSVLSRVEQGGDIGGGVQTVGTIRR
jgi:hypothetical protein